MKMQAELRHRIEHRSSTPDAVPAAIVSAATSLPKATDLPGEAHPAGDIKYGKPMQILRGVAFGIYFISCCVAIHTTQFMGAPLYLLDRHLFYAFMAMTKAYFGILITTMTHWWGPTRIRISGDDSVAAQIRKTRDGRVEFAFPDRLVMIANHQIYTDWLYLWWVGYANNPQAHGYIYIVLKESLKYLPLIGPGMMFYGFIFMSRKMATDQPRLAHRLRKLSVKHADARTGKSSFDPMWLLLFPEGTNASQHGRSMSAKWAEKMGLKDMSHMLLPRSTGMFFCLNELKGSMNYVYDCTVAYEGIPRAKFGEQYFTLSSTYFQGRSPKSVNFYWRRFRLDDIPLDSAETFDVWLRERWYEKDALMEHYLSTGRFLPSPGEAVKANGHEDGFLETEVRTRFWFEFMQIFVPIGVCGLFVRLVATIWRLVMASIG